MCSKNADELTEKTKVGPVGGDKPSGESGDAFAAEDMAERALLERPSFSIRLNIGLGLFLCFFLALVINSALLIVVNRIGEKLYFLEVTESYLAEIQQARRFEKNFFLYGTNLEDVLDHVQSAKKLLSSNATKLEKTAGVQLFNRQLKDLEHYERLLQGLTSSKEDEVDRGNAREPVASEEEIRKFGAEMVTLAQQLVYKERTTVESMIAWMKRIPIFFLGILSVLIVYLAVFLIRRIMRPMSRFMGYTKRIAQGDFTPITPTRPYRDEFSDLAIAFNRMLRELNRRQRILMESHKLRAVGSLTAGIAHELNNPINNITLTACALLDDYQEASDEERIEMIRDLVHEADRSQKIVGNLLDFARESASEIELLDPKTLIKEMLRIASNQIKISGIELRLSAKENLQRIHGDKQQLSQVFLNLIVNALDAINAHDRKGVLEVNIDRSADGNFVEIKVTDNGIGIPERLLPNIFDPFFTTKGTGKGTGLGLSVSQGIISNHGGHMEVASQLGKGTTVTVSLPITPVPAQRRNVEASE